MKWKHLFWMLWAMGILQYYNSHPFFWSWFAPR